MKTHKIPGNLKANSSQKKFSSNESAWKMKKKWAITDLNGPNGSQDISLQSQEFEQVGRRRSGLNRNSEPSRN